MSGAHAKLSASSAHRWLNCTAAPNYESQFPDETSEYAAEGTLAHSICEVSAKRALKILTDSAATQQLKTLAEDPRYDPEMLDTAEFYTQYVTDLCLGFPIEPFVALEERVDLSAWIPGGFGTCDCVVIGLGALHIVDYKHGRGVRVRAQNNSQMRLYALGALGKYDTFYGGAIQTVTMSIVQPRISREVETETVSVRELLAWGESVKVPAREAYYGPGAFHAGDWCKFCRGRAVCRERAEQATAIAEFADLKPAQLTPDEIGTLLHEGSLLCDWYHDLQAHAQAALMRGENIPGYKLVAGRGSRRWTDEAAALQTILKSGCYTEDFVYTKTARSLAQLEKAMGRKTFEDLVGSLVEHTPGKMTLVEETDPRPAIVQTQASAAADFAAIEKEN